MRFSLPIRYAAMRYAVAAIFFIAACHYVFADVMLRLSYVTLRHADAIFLCHAAIDTDVTP